MYIYHVKEMMFVNTFKTTILKFAIYFILFTIAILISIVPNLVTWNKQSAVQNRNRFPTDLKYILFWNLTRKLRHVYESTQNSEYGEGQAIFIKQNCPHINCFVTYNKSLLHNEQEFDAIVFNAKDISRNYIEELNLTRSLIQKYIFQSFESSEKYPICNPIFDDFFNSTWTYRLDSDIPNPPFNIFDENNTLVGPKKGIRWISKMKHDNRFVNKVKTKDRAVAWIVDKCKLKTKHEYFIKQLKNELKGYNYSLDIYGPCSKNKCPEKKLMKCYKMIEKSYFFHLVLEESFAEDYVSEKMVQAYTHIAVPIVSGGAHYSSFLPPGSYINARNFDIKKLGAIIDKLIRNPKMYERFFDWKNHYYFTAKPKSYICDLCTKMNNNPIVYESYPNFRLWWNSDFSDLCQRINLLNVFSND